ncbi:MAG TPA: efflux RND transporter permease subunit, partial [Bacteroidetes bacterium]|nr:efflux RND transporter permease subunit [Bacteroidota bacterium]
SKFPPTMRLIKEYDQSEDIRKELANLSSRAAFCILVIFLVLLVFLRNFISPAIILSTIFFSVMLTINFFYLADISLNLLTLAGLALGFGMLVDTSIVVFDNIFRYREQGAEPYIAALQGTKEVALPIIASTLTTISVFIPFLYMTGELRIYYLPFAMAVGLSLFSSLIVAFTFTPSLALHILRRRHEAVENHLNHPKTKSRFLLQFLVKSYRLFLAFFLRHKIFTIFLTVLLFGASYRLFDKYVTKGSIWSWGGDTYIRVGIRMPTGAELARTDEIARFFESKILGNKNVKKVFTNLSSEYGSIEIRFPREVQLTAVPLVLKEKLISYAAQIAGPNVSVSGFGPGFYRGGGSSPSFRLEVLGYNYNEVKRIAGALGKRLQRNARVRDVNTNSSFWYGGDNLFEMTLRIDRRKLQRFNLTPTAVLNSVQAYLKESLDWRRIKIGGRELEYRVKMKGYRDFQLSELERLILHTSRHEQVRLNQVAKFGQRKVLSRIVRANQQYQRWVSFEYRGPYKLGNRFVDSILNSTQLPPGYKVKRGTFFFLREEEKQQIYWVMAFSVLLVYMVTAGLFESLLYPLVVILTVPLALIGVFLIFYFTDTNFDRSAYIGVILLAGIVVNNAIILVDHINLLRHKGIALLDAVIQGAQDRFRPIIMTSATTILGLLPLVLFAGAEKGIWYALALSTIGGLFSSTLLVLVVIPVVYVIFSRRRKA